MMGRKKSDGNHSPPQNKLVPGFRGKWRKWIPSSRHQQNKDRLSQGTQQSPQEHPERWNLQEIAEKLMEMLWDKVNQNVEEALKKFQDNKNKECEKTQKQIRNS
jgi:uncharacterized protein YdiU (UPF0061 family)